MVDVEVVRKRIGGMTSSSSAIEISFHDSSIEKLVMVHNSDRLMGVKCQANTEAPASIQTE